MATKELAVKVKLNSGDAESKLKKLDTLIRGINKAITGKSNGNALENQLDRAALNAEKLKRATVQTQIAEEKLAQSQMRTQLMKDQAANRQVQQLAREEAAVDKMLNKELQAVHQKQQAQWKAFQAEQAAYEQQLRKAEQVNQRELERERIRQQSLNTLGQGDAAYQRLTASAERLNQEEYESWWLSQMQNQEWMRSHPILSRLSNLWQVINTQIRQVISGSPRLTSAYNTISARLSQIVSRIRSWWTNQNSVTSSTRTTNTLLGSVLSRLRSIATTYLGIMAARAVFGTSDLITGAQNKLNYVSAQQLGETNNDAYSSAVFEQTQLAMDKMYASANKVRMAYTDMMSNVSKSMVLAGKSFQNSTDNAIRFQEIMSEAYAVGGASTQEMHSSMYQMIQALGAGVLAGDELRSVREGAPLAYQAIEEFAQGVYDCSDSLKDMASQGKITSDMVVAAIMNAGDRIDKAFDKTEMTFAQMWTKIKNAAVKAFEPVSKAMNKMLNTAADNGLFEKIESAFISVSKALQIMFELMSRFITWTADNWNWLKYVIGGVLLFITIRLIQMTAIAVAKAAIRIAAYMVEHATMMLIVAAVVALIYVYDQWKQAAIDTCTAIVYALLIIAAVCLFIFGWQVALIIAIAALCLWLAEYIVGAIAWCIQVIVNIIAFVVNCIGAAVMFVVTLIQWVIAFIVNCVMVCVNVIATIIQWVVAFIVNLSVGLYNSISAVCQNIGIAFSNTWYGALESFWDFIASCVEGLDWLAKPLEAIAKLFGKSFDAGSFSASVRSKADAAASKQKSYVDVGDAWSKGWNTMDFASMRNAISSGWNTMDYVNMGDAVGAGWNLMDYYSPTEAYEAGKDSMSGLKDKVNKWGSQFQDGGSFIGDLFDLDKIGKSLGLDFGNINNGLPNASNPAYDVTNAYTPPSNEDLMGTGKNTGKTAKNTKDIADSMKLTEEDLKYLRDVANMEWKKEFTTANITVDMSNYNTINGENDLDGIVTKLADKLYEEMNAVADGVYV